MRIDWSMAGFRSIRYSGGAKAECERRGRGVATYANMTLKNHNGYRMASYAGRIAKQGRWQVKVIAATPYARRSNAIHNTLLKALG